MGTTILRVAKIKNMANVRQSGAHQFRHHADTPNADPALKSRNRTFVGSGNLGRDVQDKLDELTKAPRKNAVLAIDGLVTLSPEVFETKGNLNAWAFNTREWLKERFGDNLVSAVVHLDESSPHMHFTVVPMEEKPDGRKVLNARDMFDKWQLADLQRSYNDEMRKHIPTLEAPKYGSKAKHTSIKQFYSVIDEVMEQIPQAAKECMNELKDEARQTLFDRYLPMVNKMLERVEGELENKLSEEIKEDIRNKFNREMESNINNAFDETETLKRAQERMDQLAQNAKVKVDASAPKAGVSFKMT